MAYLTNYQFVAINSVRALVAAVNRFVPLIFERTLADQLRQHIFVPATVEPARLNSAAPHPRPLSEDSEDILSRYEILRVLNSKKNIKDFNFNESRNSKMLILNLNIFHIWRNAFPLQIKEKKGL